MKCWEIHVWWTGRINPDVFKIDHELIATARLASLLARFPNAEVRTRSLGSGSLVLVIEVITGVTQTAYR